MLRPILQTFTTILLLTAPLAFSQTQTGTLSGKVTTAEGVVIPNAAITVTNTATNASQKVLSSSDGSFTVNDLPAGTYRVDVETAGYKRTSEQNVSLSATGPTTVNITLEAGNTNETVEIKGKSPAVQTQGGEVALGLGERTLHETPVIDRNQQQLVELQTGITPPVAALDPVRDPNRNRFFSADGQSPFVNDWQTDGVWNTEPYRATAIRIAPIEGVRQMDVETNSMPPDKGYAGGAITSTLTGNGTNTIHGSLFEFYSGDIFHARNFYNHYDGSVKPRFVYNQFGATVGGPIIKDKTFFFGSYQGLYQSGENSTLSTLPISGTNFSSVPNLTIYNPFSGTSAGTGRSVLPGNNIPTSLLNPTARAIAGMLPSPNLPGLVDNYVSNVPFQQHANMADARIDEHFSDTTGGFLRWGYTNNWSFDGSPLGDVIGSAARNRLVAQNAVADVNHAFTDRFLTDFRFGYNRYDEKINPYGNAGPLTSSLGYSDMNTLQGINISGLPLIGSPAYAPENGVDNTFNWVWTFAYHRGHNNIIFGTDIRRVRTDGFTDGLLGGMFGPSGTAYFGPGATLAPGTSLSPYSTLYNSYAAFLMGAPSQIGALNYVTTPTIRQTQYSAWLGDTVNLTSRITADLGVRYDIFSPLSPRNPGGAAYFDPATNSYNYAGIDGTGMYNTLYQTRNIAPRVGLAARLTDKTVFRAGYAINYFQLPYMYSGLMPPVYGSVLGTAGSYTVAPLNSPFGVNFGTSLTPPATLQNGNTAANLPVVLTARNIPTPYVQNFNAQVQQQFYFGTVLSVGYMGALGRHLPGIEQLNASLPGTGVTGLPYYSMGRTTSVLGYDNGLTSNYNSLQVSLTKRFSGGLSFAAAYTFAKALGYTTGNNMLLNPTNLSADYGPLDYDRQHVLTISHIWELPFGQHGNSIMSSVLGGWELNGVFTWATGTPLTVTADPLSCGCVGNTVMANLNPGVNPILASGTSYLNPAAFSAPTNSFGSLNRGAVYGQGYRNYDLALFKNFHVHDRFNVQLRGEAYNLTNTPRWGSPMTNISSPNFGEQVNPMNGAFGRQVNLGARILF
jgi:hypothetical protein